AAPASPMTYTPTLRLRLGRSLGHNVGPFLFAGLLTFGVVALPSPWHWIPLAGLALVLPYGVLRMILTAAGFPTLRVDRTGISLASPAVGRWLWDWESLTTVEIQSAPGTRVLTAVPLNGAAPEPGTPKRFFWYRDRYAITDLHLIGADEQAVAAALTHCSAGRFRTPSARLPFRKGPNVTEPPLTRYEVSPDQVPCGGSDHWRPDSSGWLRERTASRARHCAGWLLLGGAALGGWIALLGAIDGATELLALPLAGFGIHALLKKAPVAWDGARLRVTRAGLTFLAADSDTPIHEPWARLRADGWVAWAAMAGVPSEAVAAEVARIRPARRSGG
ncbi:hypothetical protein, partial [Streptomyces resistomycificus]